MKTNSRNSSKPPSSDGPGVKGVEKKDGKKTAEESPKRGGQKGHEGAKRERLTADNIIDVWPENCQACEKELPKGQTSSKTKWCQVLELPEIKACVTEYRAHTSTCACGTETSAVLPAEALMHGFGPRLSALVAYLTGQCRLSKRQVTEFLKDALGTPMSLGAVCDIEQDVSEALEAPIREATEYIRSQNVVHMDETGWRENKRRAWLWVAATATATVFRISPSRATAVAKHILGESFAGRLVTDRFGAYNWVVSSMRQLCWAHLIRDMRGIIERGGPPKAFAQAILLEVGKMMEWWAKVRDGEMTRTCFQAKMAPLRVEVEALLTKAAACPEKKASGMCKAILKHKEALWTFVDVENVEPTNNLAERSIRPAVLWRKGSFGTDSEKGSRFAERILSAIATLRQRKSNVLRYLTLACLQSRNNRPAPSLLQVTANS